MQKVSQTNLDALDPILGYSYSSVNIPNWEWKNGLYTRSGDGNLNIGILGGSTSDLAYSDSWVDFLSEKVSFKNIYSGAVSGYNSSQEVFKFIRDLMPYRPEVIISFSGINDIGHIQSKSTIEGRIHHYQRDLFENILRRSEKKIGSYFRSTPSAMNKKAPLKSVIYGSKSRLKSWELWLENQLIMKSIADGFGIKFISILQPTLGIGNYSMNDVEYKALHEYSQNFRLLEGKNYLEKTHEFYFEIQRKIAKTHSFVHDFSGIFDNYTELYKDPRHPNSKGNQIISNEISQLIANLT